jgi:tetratricopeptide (TPR) repeat protein
LDEAIVAHLEAIRIDPGFAEAHYKFGVALLEANRFAEAIAAFDKVLELDAGETGELANTASLRTLCENSQRAGVLPENAQIAVAINVSGEPLAQIQECFTRLSANLPKAKVAIFLDGVSRPEVVDLANDFRFSPKVVTKLGTNATWNLWWLRMMRFFADTEADVCFKFDPDTMVDAAPKAILDADYFGHVCAEYVQGGVTGISRALVRAVLERKLLESSEEEPRPWLAEFSDPRYIDDQKIAQVFAHLGVRPIKWRECRSIWRWPVPNDPVTHAVVHPRYYGTPGIS